MAEDLFTETESLIIIGHQLQSIMEPKGLIWIMNQAHVNREQAFQCLINNGGDIINAIMELMPLWH